MGKKYVIEVELIDGPYDKCDLKLALNKVGCIEAYVFLDDFPAIKSASKSDVAAYISKMAAASGIQISIGESEEDCGCRSCQTDREEAKKVEDSESSVIARAVYDWPAKFLDITFKESGHTYRYFSVPVDTYYNLLYAQSMGSFFNKYIKGEFNHEKL